MPQVDPKDGVPGGKDATSSWRVTTLPALTGRPVDGLIRTQQSSAASDECFGESVLQRGNRHERRNLLCSSTMNVSPLFTARSPLPSTSSTPCSPRRASIEADRYASAVACVLETLANDATIRQLVTAYQSPDAAVRTHVFDLCGVGNARLDPRVVVGAACALRFRHLMDQAVE